MPAGFVQATAYGSLQAAANDAAAQAKGVWQDDFYALTSALTIPAGVHWETVEGIRWDGGTGVPAITVGQSGVANFGRDITLSMWRSGEQWPASDDDVGVRIYNPQCCRIRILSARGFTRGVQIVADGGLEAYGNLIEFGLVSNNRYQVVMDARANSKIRDNILIGARLSFFSNFNNVSGPRRFWVLESSDGTSAANVRNNLWLKPSLEGHRGPDSGPVMAYMWSQGAENEMWGARDESGLDTNGSAGGSDSHLIADGPHAEWNIQHNGFFDFNRDPLAVGLVNAAPTGRNAAGRIREEAENLDSIGYLQL